MKRDVLVHPNINSHLVVEAFLSEIKKESFFLKKTRHDLGSHNTKRDANDTATPNFRVSANIIDPLFYLIRNNLG